MTTEEFCVHECGCGEKFWEKYFAADEPERIMLLKSLPIFSKMKEGIWFAECVTPALLKSYIDDAINYAKSHSHAQT
jgi:hypothetical protein